MKHKSNLFELIKSLSKTEKGYFKKYCSLHGEGSKKYLSLFDTINNMHEYSEKEVEIVFKKESLSSELSVIKTYLYKLLLRSLESYHTNIVFDLRSSLTQCEILYQKGLFGQCKRLINKIKKEAQRHDQYLYVYEALKIESKMISQLSGMEPSAVNRITREIRKAFSLLNNIETYADLKVKENAILGGDVSKMAAAMPLHKRKQYERFMRTKELSSEKNALTITSKLIYNQIHSMYNLAHANYKKALGYATRKVQLLETHPHFIEKKPFDYIISVSLLIRTYAGLKMYEHALSNIRKMKAIEKTHNIKLSNLRQKTLFSMSYMAETAIYYESGQFDKISHILPEIEMGLEKYDSLLSVVGKCAIYYNVALLQFGNNQYRSALEWNNKVINTLLHSNTNHTLYYTARCFQLIIHFELGNMDLIPYLMKSLYRMFYKNPSAFELESLILRFISKILKEVNTVSDNKMTNLFKEFRTSIFKNMKKNKYGDIETIRFYILWLTGKIENKSIVQIATQKNFGL